MNLESSHRWKLPSIKYLQGKFLSPSTPDLSLARPQFLKLKHGAISTQSIKRQENQNKQLIT